MKIVFALICGFICCISSAQELNYKSIDKIEDYILNEEKDSALFYINILKQESNDSYLNTLESLSSKKKPSFFDYYLFSARIFKKQSKSRDNQFFKFVSAIEAPKHQKAINIDYVYTKWLYISRLRDIAQLEKANIENEKLEDYINKYNEKDPSYIKAQLLLDIHGIVLNIIEKDIKGKAKCIKNIEQIKSINDKELEALYLSYLCDFYVIEKDLDTYIKTAENSIKIEKNLPIKTFVYESTIEKLIDGYLFKGGKNNEALKLLEELYYSSENRYFSYSLYANFLRTINPTDPLNEKIFKQFEVDNVIAFCNKIEKESVDVLDPNRVYFVFSQSSKLLQKRGFLNEAIAYKSKCIVLHEKIYSEDLTNSLYNYKSEQEIKQKELEIEYHKEKGNLYIVIALVLVFAFLVLAFIIYKMLKQTKELKIKNKKIEEQRDAISKKEKEKALLLKEVHHRVKNNFQIVSSLLELQTKGIEDKKALELAEEGKNRVKSMALIHQRLYQNDDLLIDFDEYIQSLVKDISSMYGKDKNPKINLNIPDYKFDIDTAIPLGLIINELITNAYKYGFSNKEQTLDIEISKEENENYLLKIKDNGLGLPESFDFSKAKSLGLRLVRRLSKQLHGSTTYSYDKGSLFSVMFKDTNARGAID